MRAKTINEIKRGGDSLQSMNVGTSRVSPALAYMRELCPGCISKLTVEDKIARFSNLTADPHALKTYVELFEEKVGDPRDFIALDFILKFDGSDTIKHVYEDALDEMYDTYFGSMSGEKGDDMEEIFDDSWNDHYGKPLESYKCDYNAVDCIGSISMSEVSNRAYMSCYFVKG